MPASLGGPMIVSYGTLEDKTIKERFTKRSNETGPFDSVESVNIPLSWAENEESWYIILHLDQVKDPSCSLWLLY